MTARGAGDAGDGSPPPHAVADLPDAELVAMVLGGGTDSYGHLVRRYQDTMYRVAWGMVRDPDAALDLVQDAFIRAFANLVHCREPAHFRVWAMTMLRNRCLDYLKERRRRDVPLDTMADFYLGHDGDVLETLAERNELQLALDSLPATLREAFLLRHVEDLTYEEMASVLQTTVAGVKMRVSRAREVLRTSLSGSDGTSARDDVTAGESRSSHRRALDATE
ncbi:MAG TPA: sigma-70 family RNA polymerase sigma factor [Longimicrobiales bacterium]|nr:sigma-70 family RNA polymerase sigma factor [Longimicrobiales bacterium]